MASKARSRELMSKFLFTVHDADGGFQNSKFQKCTGQEMSVGIAEYAEGGAFAPLKEPGRVAFGNITLEHGVSDNLDFCNWMDQVCNMLSYTPEGAGLLTLDLIRDLYAIQRDRTQTARIKWNFAAAFPARWRGSEFDNTTDEVQVEELELAHWYNYREAA